jgi:hypothetical protein
MLDDLRRIIESEMEYDDLNDIMMEATDNAIAAMFIEEDGEAVISDAEVMGILEKIPEYDEETAMNKKLARIAEAYIPEELVGLQESTQDDYNRDSVKRIDDKLNAVKESTEVDDDLTYLYEMFDLDDLIK